MKTRLPISGSTALTLIALTFGIALGHPAPQQPPEPGLTAAGANPVIIECPPPPARGGSDC